MRWPRWLVALVVCAAPWPRASAEPVYWNATETLWTIAAGWSANPDGTGAAAVPTAGDVAIFSATPVTTAPTVSLGADVAAAGLEFAAGSTGTTTLVGGGTNRTLTLGGSGILVAAAADAVAIGSATAGEQVAIVLSADQSWTNAGAGLLTVANGVSRAAGDATSRTLTLGGSGDISLDGPVVNGGAAGTLALVKTGAGTVTLAGGNTFTGGTTVNDGRLVFTSGSPGGNTFTLAGGTLEFASGSNVQLSGGSISGSGTLVKRGAGQLWLGANGQPQAISLAAGSLIDVQEGLLRNEYGAGDWSANQAALNVAAGATVQLWDSNITVDALTGSGTIDKGQNNVHTLTVGVADGSGEFAGLIRNLVGTLNLTKAGAGTQTLAGANTFTGDTLVTGGTLLLANASALGGSSLDTSGAGSLSFGALETVSLGGLKGSGSLVLENAGAAAVALTVGANNQNTTLTGNLSGSGSLLKAGSGSLTLAGTANTHAGGTTVAAGTLVFATPAAVPTVTTTAAAGATVGLRLGAGAFTEADLQALLDDTFAGVALDATAWAGIDTTPGGVTVSSALTGSRGLVKLGPNTLTLSAANSYAGGTRIAQGVIQLTNAAALGAGPVTVTPGGQAFINANALTVANDFTLSGTTTNGAIYSGDRPAGNVTTLTGTITLAATSNVASWWNDKTLRIDGQLTGPGGLILDPVATSVGGRFLITGGSNNYAGPTTVNGRSGAGVSGFPGESLLYLGADNALPTTSGLTLNNARLYLNGRSQSVPTIAGSGNHSIQNGSSLPGTITIGSSGANSTFGEILDNGIPVTSSTGNPATVVGTVALVKVGGGSLTLTGTNTFSGGTTVSGGFLQIFTDAQLGAVPASPTVSLTLNGGGVKNNQSSPVLASNRTISLGSGGGWFTSGWNNPTTIQGRITGPGSFTVNTDSGPVILTNPANDWAGNTTIGATLAGWSGTTATLRLGASEVIPHGVGNGTLLFGGISGLATLDLNGFDETVNGPSGGGNARINNSAAGTASRLTANVASGSTTFGGILQNTGSGATLAFVKTGAGDLWLQGANTHTGGTTVEGGYIWIAGEGQLGPTPATPTVNLTLDGGGVKNRESSPVYAANRTILLGAGGGWFTSGWNNPTTIHGLITGEGSFTVNNDSGPVILTNPANDWAGDTTIGGTLAGAFGSNATLRVGASGVIPDGPGRGVLRFNASGTGTLDLNGQSETVNALVTPGGGTSRVIGGGTLTVGAGDGSGTYNGFFQDAMSLVKIGTGTQALTGSSSYTGTTTINGGVLAVSSLANGGGNSGIGASSSDAANLVLAGGTLRFTGAGTTTSTNRNFTIAAGTTGTLDVSGATSRITFTGATAATTGTLVKSGPGEVIMTGGNAHTGGTVISGGALWVTGDAQLGPVPASPTVNLTLDGGGLKNNSSVPVYAVNRTILLGPGGGWITSGWNNPTTINGQITGAGSFTVNNDSGPVILTNPANDWSGGTTIGGTLTGFSSVNATMRLGAAGVIPDGLAAGNVSFNPSAGGTATLDLNGHSETVNALVTIGAGTSRVIGSGTLTVGAGDASGGYAGTLQDGLRLVKVGSGTQSLSAPSSFTGGTTISGGTLLAGHANALGTSGTIAIEAAGTLGLADGIAFTRPLTIAAGGKVSLGLGASVALPDAAALAAFESTSPVGSLTRAEILFGSGSTVPTALTSTWTARPAGEFFSDILSLEGTGAGNTYVLSLESESIFGGLNIAYRETALDPFVPLGTAFQGSVAWNSGFTTVGQYGIDPAAGTVWVVTDHNSQFVIVPEPRLLPVVLGAAVAAAALARRRTRACSLTPSASCRP